MQCTLSSVLVFIFQWFIPSFLYRGSFTPSLAICSIHHWPSNMCLIITMMMFTGAQQTWLDNWSLLHHVRPVSQRRHQRAGKKYNAEYTCKTCNIQHSVYCHFQIYNVDLISDERVWMRVMWCSLKVCRCILMWPDCGRSLRSTESLSSTPHPLL